MVKDPVLIYHRVHFTGGDRLRKIYHSQLLHCQDYIDATKKITPATKKRIK